MKRLILSFFLCLPGLAIAGPFGTQMGDVPDKYPDLARVPENLFSTTAVPKPHSRLDSYRLGFYQGGLDRVVAFTEYERDAEGRKAAPLFNSLRKDLTEKYGKPARSGGNMFGSLWTKGMTVWEGDLPDDLARIILALHSGDGVKSSVSLIYIYRNLPSLEEQEKMDRETL